MNFQVLSFVMIFYTDFSGQIKEKEFALGMIFSKVDRSDQTVWARKSNSLQEYNIYIYHCNLAWCSFMVVWERHSLCNGGIFKSYSAPRQLKCLGLFSFLYIINFEGLAVELTCQAYKKKPAVKHVDRDSPSGSLEILSWAFSSSVGQWEWPWYSTFNRFSTSFKLQYPVWHSLTSTSKSLTSCFGFTLMNISYFPNCRFSSSSYVSSKVTLLAAAMLTETVNFSVFLPEALYLSG